MREDSNFCWAVVCKNQWFHLPRNFLKGHRILLGKADNETSLPALEGGFTVRCDKCSEEYVYQPVEVRRYEHKNLPESFDPHPLFQIGEDRRRSPRSRREVRLLVWGENVERLAFEEKTYATSISDHGAVMMLSRAVEPGQTLLLKNPRNQNEIQCQVVRFGPPYKGHGQVCVEFPYPAREFWSSDSEVGSKSTNAQSSVSMRS